MATNIPSKPNESATPLNHSGTGSGSGGVMNAAAPEPKTVHTKSAILTRNQKRMEEIYEEIIQHTFFNEKSIYSKHQQKETDKFDPYKLPAKPIQKRVAQCVYRISTSKQKEKSNIKEEERLKEQKLSRDEEAAKILPKKAKNRINSTLKKVYSALREESTSVIKGQATALKAIRLEEIVYDMPFFRYKETPADLLKKIPRLSAQDSLRVQKLMNQ